MIDEATFLGIDWGTTNRRIFRIEAGQVVASEADGRGVATIANHEFAGEVARIRGRLGDLPVIMAGMVGSTIGWREAPYISVPAGAAAIARDLAWIDDRTAIIPGVSVLRDGRADVMRGEEVQLIGAVRTGMAPPDALLCQPGTHCKWARMAAGEIADFTTAMTGELFALLRTHGLLAAQLGAGVTPGPAFRAGVEDGKRRDLQASLFGIRASKLLGQRDDTDAASYASGLLIGADVAARVRPGADVYILAGAQLGPLYAIAVEANGGSAFVIDSQAAFVAGIVAVKEYIA